MRLLLAAALAAVQTVVQTVAVAPQPAHAADRGGLGIRLVDAPTALRDDPRARLYIIDHVAPGQVVERRIAVADTTRSALSASLYVGGATIGSGSFTPADKGVPSELGSWSSLSPSSLRLAAGQSKQAVVRITVPRDATDGERYGVIWAELPPAGDGTVKQVNRVGIRIYLSVGNGKSPPISFAVDELQAQRRADGVPLVRATVRNTGGRALDLNGVLSLSDGPGGLAGGPYPAALGTTLGIGQQAPVTVLLPKAIGGGPWTAKLTLRSDTVSETVTGRLTFPAAGRTSPPVRPQPQPAGDDHLVLLVAGGVAGLLLLLLLLLLLRHRRRPPDRVVTT